MSDFIYGPGNGAGTKCEKCGNHYHGSVYAQCPTCRVASPAPSSNETPPQCEQCDRTHGDIVAAREIVLKFAQLNREHLVSLPSPNDIARLIAKHRGEKFEGDTVVCERWWVEDKKADEDALLRLAGFLAKHDLRTHTSSVDSAIAFIDAAIIAKHAQAGNAAPARGETGEGE